ncbi:MAG TPA: hypothetical protein ENG87_05890 [Candidatus Pacearchaeota archaeon]|nr:hypothetical protein [Candidatus Pacearchaeota archaeon]
MWKEYFIYGISKTLTAGTGTSFESNNMRIDSDADFEFNKSTYVATNDRIKLKYKDDSIGRYLTKGQPDIKAIAGRNILPMGLSNSFIPFIWPRPYIISAGTNFVVETADYSNAANTLRLAFHGGKIRQGEAPWKKRFRAAVPFVYSFTNGSQTVTANSTITPTIEVDIDAHFLVQKITGIRTGEALVLINEGARGREWSNVALHIDNFIGNGSFPNILMANRFILRGSVVSFNIQDISGASNVIDIDLIGVKLYE